MNFQRGRLSVKPTTHNEFPVRESGAPSNPPTTSSVRDGNDVKGRPPHRGGLEQVTSFYKAMIITEQFTLEYTRLVLEDMSDARREIFSGPLRKYVISSVYVHDILVIRFYFYQDHLLEAVEKWPWLLCSDLGAHLEPIYKDQTEFSYQSVTQNAYPMFPRKKNWTP